MPIVRPITRPLGSKALAESSASGLSWEGKNPSTTLVYAHQGYAASNFYEAADSEGIYGSDTAFWLGVLFTAPPTSGSNETVTIAGLAGSRGWRIRFTSAGNLIGTAINGTPTAVNTPASADLSGTSTVHGAVLVLGTDNILRLYLDRAELGSGTAFVGYTLPSATDRHRIGLSTTGTQAYSGRILGVCGADGVAPTSANVNLWYDNCRTNTDIAVMPGTTTDQLWSVKREAAAVETEWVDSQGTTENMDKSGTLITDSRFVPEWAW